MTTYSENDSCHVCKNVSLAVLMFLSFILAIFTNFYISTNGNTVLVNADYPSPIMASDWTFVTMWSLIYIFQFLWMLYLLILTIKFASRESLFSTVFYLAFILVNVGNSGIIFFWDLAINNDSFILFASISCMIVDICLYIALFSSMRTLLAPVHSGLLPEWATSTIRKLLVVLLVNGVGLHLGWITYICNLYFALALRYYWDVSDTGASFVGLSMMALALIIYSVFNFVWLDYYFSNVYTVFPALIISLTGILTKQGVGSDNGASIMATVLVALSSILFIAKIAVNCVKSKRRSENYGILDYGYDMAKI